MEPRWNHLPCKTKANCVFNFNVPPVPLLPGEPVRLSLFLGDPVIIIAEFGDWYYGHTLANEAHKGVFPKSYVHLASSEVVKEPLVEEINSSLKEWNEKMKDKFIKDDSSVKAFRGIMRDITSNRSSLATGKLSEEEAKETRQKVVTKMDFLNHQLDLDLVVRDANGLVLQPNKTSAVSLYRHHVKTAEKIGRGVGAVPVLDTNHDDVHVTNSFRIMLQVKNFYSTKVQEEVDLIISVYEVVEGRPPKPICENYIIDAWKRRSSVSSTGSGGNSNNLRVLFEGISKNDITDKKLYLICNVVTNGNYSKYVSPSHEAASKIFFRKPIGVAAQDITGFFTFTQNRRTARMTGAENKISCPFLLGSETETLETTFRKLVYDKKNIEQDVLQGQISILSGDVGFDQLLPSQYNYAGRILTSKKLGLPEVILPDDVRNDLYVTINSGELSRLEKMQDRNIELMMEVCDDSGQTVKEAISLGVGFEARDNFKSVVYRHEGKPRWNEVVCITLPADQFAKCHLRFTFTHRSRKDEKTPPWAMSFLKLVSEHDETAIKDQTHELIVYKIEKKVEVDNTAFYLDMPYYKSGSTFKPKNHNGLSVIGKDVLVVSTTLASTKLTQNDGLLRLLDWKSYPEQLGNILNTFNKKVTATEFAKFISDVLDALFSILMLNGDDASFDNLVFKTLVSAILLITDENNKCTQFVPVLELYINNNFYATLAYNKLLVVLKESIDNATTHAKDLTRVMKCLCYIFKFVVRSRELFSNCNDGKGREPFEQLLSEVLTSLIKLMFYKSNDLYQAQSFCLKQMILAVPDLTKVYTDTDLAHIIVKMINGLPEKQLDDSKISTIKEIVHCPLFESIECREILLPAMANLMADLAAMNYMRPLSGPVAETMGDILDRLTGLRPNERDIGVVMHSCLRVIIDSVAKRGKPDENMKAILANMICLLNEMTPSHYANYIDSFNIKEREGREDLIDFIMEVLSLFKDLIMHDVFPSDWTTMIMLQNHVIMRALCQFSCTIRDFFTYDTDFHLTAWGNFFRCAISFIKQPSLQLEKFSENKKLKILNAYKDMRKEMGEKVRTMWFNLGTNKINFVPDMVGDFLEMALIPETDIRKTTIPIFFDMIQCEYYSSRFGNNRRDSTMSKANFDEFQNALIAKLDLFIGEEGLGDDHFLQKFRSIMMSHCEKHTSIRDSGVHYVELTSRLIELLLEYRTTKTSNDSKENQMSCIVNLLDFYSEIRRDDLYVKYLKELASLHEKCQNHAEAGFTILQYALLLEWSEKSLDHQWEKYRNCKTHRQLKEHLYKEVIHLFQEGKMWEKALEICKELRAQYETVTFDYVELAKLCQDMADFYKKIMNDADIERRKPHYFRVAFIGRGFPAFLQNKTFVYRGSGFESLDGFITRILDQFPHAEKLMKLDPPTDEQREDSKQLVQINMVDPVMEERLDFEGRIISPQIREYYKLNEVCRFTFSRPFHKGQRDKENEFATLWIERTMIQTRDSFPGILQWFPVVDPPVVYELTPLDNAIETMEKANDSLRSLIQEHTRESNHPPINPLSMKLKGIIDAAVMGGTANYEKAFFTEKYSMEHPEDGEKIQQLKDHIADQIPLLSTGIQIHDAKKPADLQPLHDQMDGMFQRMKKSVEDKYGRRSCEFTVHKVENNRRKGQVFDAENFSNHSMSNSTNHHQSFAHSNSLDLDHVETQRASFNSQNSLDATPLIKARNMITNSMGITRRRSNASSMNRNDEVRGSTASQHHNRTLNTTMESCLDESSSANLGTTIIVTDSRLSVHNLGGSSRPPSGHHFLTTSTPNHSRSPSMQSNRDSLLSNDEVCPPILPLKNRGIEINNGCNNLDALSNCDSNSNTSGSREDILSYKVVKKKAPPPPPPILINNNGGSTPPTPPRRPQMRQPMDE